MRLLSAICFSIISVTSLAAVTPESLNLEFVQSRPVATGVYLNGQGPFRFLLDTGAQTNQLDAALRTKLALVPTFRTELATAAGSQLVPGLKMSEVRLGPAEAKDQEFLLTDLAAIKTLDHHIDGVLGQEFLAKFDYLLDFEGSRIIFGASAPAGTQVRVQRRNGTMIVPTSEGSMVLDSGTSAAVLFRAGSSPNSARIATASGVASASLEKAHRIKIAGHDYRPGQTAFAAASYTGVAGLLPASLFRSVFISNSGSYIVLE